MPVTEYTVMDAGAGGGAAAAVAVVEASAAVVVVSANVALGSVPALALSDEPDEPDEPVELHAPSSDIATNPMTVLLPIWKF